MVGREVAAQFRPQRRGEVSLATLRVARCQQDFGERVGALRAQDGLDIGGHGLVGMGKEGGLRVVESDGGVIGGEAVRAGVNLRRRRVLVVATVTAGKGAELRRVAAVNARLQGLAVDGEAFLRHALNVAEVLAAYEGGGELLLQVVPAVAVTVGLLPQGDGGRDGKEGKGVEPRRQTGCSRRFARAQGFEFVVETVIALVLPRRIIGGAPGGNQCALLGGRIRGGIAAVRRAQQGQEGEEGKEDWREEVGHGVQGAGVWELDFAADFWRRAIFIRRAER